MAYEKTEKGRQAAIKSAISLADLIVDNTTQEGT